MLDLVSVELHEKYEKEEIPKTDHDRVHQLLKELNYTQIVTKGQIEYKTLRACYVGTGAAPQKMEELQARLSKELKRDVGIMFAAKGEVHSFGLAKKPPFH